MAARIVSTCTQRTRAPRGRRNSDCTYSRPGGKRRFYSAKERAALAWAEAVTQICTREISDELYAEARRHFDDKALVDLTLAIIAINGWNRLAVPFRAETGSYQAGSVHRE